MGLTSRQIEIIKATVPVIQQHGKTVTTVFYQNLLAEHPELKNMFNTASQLNGHQPTALANALFAYASNIDNLAALASFVDRVCRKHASLYVQRDQYDIVGRFLLAAMRQCLGVDFTSEVEAAWAAAYTQLANVMAGTEDDLYQQVGGWTTWKEFKISRKIEESSVITSFYLEPLDGMTLPSFRPGQYISVRTDVPALGHLQARQYSLSDLPDPRYYRISVKREVGVDPFDSRALAHPGYLSNVLHDLKHVGDTVQVSHPQGEFFLTHSESSPRPPIVLLSAGVGITPMISILNYLTSPVNAPHLKEQRISFIHGTRNSTVQAFRDHVKALQDLFPKTLKVSTFNKGPELHEQSGIDYHHTGRIDLDQLEGEEDLCLDCPNTEYYVCGPVSFMVDMRNALMTRKVDIERIKLEVFGAGGI